MQAMRGRNDCEIVDETEMMTLLQYNETTGQFVGFFYGVGESGERELTFFPEICEECQRKEARFLEEFER